MGMRGWDVAVLDSHESHASYRRHSSGCLRRTVVLGFNPLNPPSPRSDKTSVLAFRQFGPPQAGPGLPTWAKEKDTYLPHSSKQTKTTISQPLAGPDAESLHPPCRN